MLDALKSLPEDPAEPRAVSERLMAEVQSQTYRIEKLKAELHGHRKARLFHEHVLVKTPKSGTPTPWHQDLPYYCLDASQTVSLWIPLNDVPRERTLEFVAGPPEWGKFYRPQRFDGTPLNEDDGLEELPDIDGNRGEYNILG